MHKLLGNMVNRKLSCSLDFQQIFSALEEYYRSCDAPVKHFESVSAASPLQILVSAMLSARTLDSTTTKVMENWRISELSQLKDLSAEDIQKLIYPVGFYQQKALHLSKWYEHIQENFAGQLPTNRQQTMSLPGVGLKTANLYLSRAYGLPFVCVDIHVHRICARLGITSGQTPQKTEQELAKLLPTKYIGKANRYFVALGQTLCKAKTTQCKVCPLGDICPRIGV